MCELYCVAFRVSIVPQNVNKEEKYTSFMVKCKAFVMEAKLPGIFAIRKTYF